MRLWKKTGISIFPLPLWLSSNLNIFDRSILGAASRIGDSFRFEINISPRWNARWKGGVERWRSGRIKEKRVLRIETKRALLLGTLIFIVAEVCARFLQSHTLSTLASPSFTIPATSLETTIFPRPSKTLSLSFHGMKRRIFFALCTSSPSPSLPKLPTKWRVETSLSSLSSLSLPLTVCKISLRVLSAYSPHLPLQQGNRETSPATDSFPLRTTPSADKTSRITIFSTGIDRRCTLAKVSLRFEHFSTLSSSPRFFLYIADILQS